MNTFSNAGIAGLCSLTYLELGSARIITHLRGDVKGGDDPRASWSLCLLAAAVDAILTAVP